MTASSERLSLKQRLRQSPAILAPGVFDPLSALIAQQSGFEAVYLSGAAVAYTQFGRSDVGLTTANEAANVLARISDRVDIPIIADGDNGFGNALNTQRTVRDFERAGAAMIQLEDQAFPKRCGHLNDKVLISKQQMCGKLKAALDARKCEDTLIIARTDALAVEGFEAALDRAEAYVECGVDVLFVEAVRTTEHMDRVCQQFGPRIPLLANMVEGGKTPVLSVDELSSRGYSIVIFPGGTVRFLAKQMQRYFSSLKEHGSTRAMSSEMLDFDGLNTLIGTPELLALGKKYDG